MTDRLIGKRIFLTGAAQGIGRAIARRCLAEGAALFLIDRDAETLAAAVQYLSNGAGRNSQLGAAVADISDSAAVSAAMAEASDAIGPINALINNAGINVFHEPLQTTDEDWDRCFDVNLKGAWHCCRAALPGMIAAGGGVILNILSTHSFTIIPKTFPYPVAKHALLGLTKSLAMEYAAQGIRVNAIAPGYVETQKLLDWWAAAPDPAAARAQTLALHPSGQVAQPDEISKAALFMISDDCPSMTAATLMIDGGLSMLQHG